MPEGWELDSKPEWAAMYEASREARRQQDALEKAKKEKEMEREQKGAVQLAIEEAKRWGVESGYYLLSDSKILLVQILGLWENRTIKVGAAYFGYLRPESKGFFSNSKEKFKCFRDPQRISRYGIPEFAEIVDLLKGSKFLGTKLSESGVSGVTDLYKEEFNCSFESPYMPPSMAGGAKMRRSLSRRSGRKYRSHRRHSGRKHSVSKH
jgi:hypothetical protein